ncbi:MAG: [protein-PII] uridylyltransferase [Pseudomonadota bacterium]
MSGAASASSVPPRAPSRRKTRRGGPKPAPDAARAADAAAQAQGAAPGRGDFVLILPAREILDRDAVLARLTEAAADLRDDASGPRRVGFAAVLREALDQGRSAIETAGEARPWAGPAASRSSAWLTDEIVRLTLETALRWLHPNPTPTEGERLAVLAVGGYGRFEMAPHSDVDLLFLIHWKQAAWVESLVESVLYLLWDLRLKVGHATRSVDDCLRLAKQDMTIRTALLEHRFISGDAALAASLEQRLWDDLFARSGPEFVEAKLEERAQRHDRHGGSRYLLEPNVKESKGGLRDLQTLWWIAKYLYHARSPTDLVEKGVFAEDEVAVFAEAEAFLWTVRMHLHWSSARANELLSFDQQVEIARRLGFDDTEGQRGVERFMQRYFQHAKAVGELTRIFLAALEARHVKKRPVLASLRRAFGLQGGTAPGPFQMLDGRITVPDEAVLRDDPVNILRLFDAGLRTGALIHPNAMRMLAANLDLIDDAVRADPTANRLFLEMLVNSDDPERALRRMNETGVLGAFMPEFGRIVAMMQYNMYHHYTVDEHSILAVSILHRIERGELVEDLPVASGILEQGVDRTILYVALLLHDIGKGRPEDHSILGEALAREICPRLGLDESQSETVCWLIRHHLLMSDVAQKRDISDPATVEAFAREVRAPSRLNLLLVLTVCDIMAVSPGAWNNWKAQLLRTLHRRTREALTGGGDQPSRNERIHEAQDDFRAALPSWTFEEAEAEIARHYPPFFLSLSAESQAVFARLGRDAKDAEVASDFARDESRDATRACFYNADHPGVFSRLAGALALAGANVVDARTFTTSDGYACSAFWIQAGDGSPYATDRLDRLRRTVDRILKGEVVARDALMPKRKVKRRESEFHVPTRVAFDNASSDIYTVIEVDTQDRVGLLHDLTKALAAANITISSALIATYGEQAVDVFYVKDLFGLKITAESKKTSIETRLRAAIEAAAPSDAASPKG